MAGACAVFKRNAAASDYKETPQDNNFHFCKCGFVLTVAACKGAGGLLHPFYSNGLPHEEEVVSFLPHAVSKL